MAGNSLPVEMVALSLLGLQKMAAKNCPKGQFSKEIKELMDTLEGMLPEDLQGDASGIMYLRNVQLAGGNVTTVRAAKELINSSSRLLESLDFTTTVG